MNETIDLMKKHTSVRRFTEEQISDEDLKSIIDAGRTPFSARLRSPIKRRKTDD